MRAAGRYAIVLILLSAGSVQAAKRKGRSAKACARPRSMRSAATPCHRAPAAVGAAPTAACERGRGRARPDRGKAELPRVDRAKPAVQRGDGQEGLRGRVSGIRHPLEFARLRCGQNVPRQVHLRGAGVAPGASPGSGPTAPCFLNPTPVSAATRRTTYISRQARRGGGGDVEITGQHDIDAGWMADVRRFCADPDPESRACPCIVPRLALEMPPPGPEEAPAVAAQVADLLVERGFDGVVLEMTLQPASLDLLSHLFTALHAREATRSTLAATAERDISADGTVHDPAPSSSGDAMQLLLVLPPSRGAAARAQRVHRRRPCSPPAHATLPPPFGSCPQGRSA